VSSRKDCTLDAQCSLGAGNTEYTSSTTYTFAESVRASKKTSSTFPLSLVITSLRLFSRVGVSFWGRGACGSRDTKKAHLSMNIALATRTYASLALWALIRRRPSIMAIIPPVDVPQMRSNIWNGSTRRPILLQIALTNDSTSKMAESPRTPSPSRESSTLVSRVAGRGNGDFGEVGASRYGSKLS
jgi:hypothetical protein